MFAKLFHQVVYSSLTQKEPVFVRGVFFMLMAIADKGGSVLGTDESIARVINVPIDEFNEALTALMAPDPDSQSKEHEGRRIIRLDGVPGLFLVNYVKYAEIGSDEQRREYFRIKKAESRARTKSKEQEPETPVSKGFTPPSRAELDLHAAKIGLPPIEVEKFINFYESKNWMVGKNKMARWKGALSNWKLNWEDQRQSKTQPDQPDLGYDPNDPSILENWKRQQ